MQTPAAALPGALGALMPLQVCHTRGDAEVGLVGGHVVDPVVLAGQDDVPVLQEHDPAGEAEVRVGPLVDLVGHGYEDDEGKDVALPGTGLTQGLCKTPAAAVAGHTCARTASCPARAACCCRS